MIRRRFRAPFELRALSLALLDLYLMKLLTVCRLLDSASQMNRGKMDFLSILGALRFHCYEILDFPQNGLAHFVGSPRFHNSEILVPPKSKEKSIFPRFIWEAEESNRQTVKSFIKYRSRRARKMSLSSNGARKRLLNKMLQKIS